jgi:uncharacterized membrane protein
VQRGGSTEGSSSADNGRSNIGATGIAVRVTRHRRIDTMSTRVIASSALASVLAMGLLSAAHAADPNHEKEKCFGIAKPGSNDCANLSGSHSCAGQSKNAMAADEWNYVAKGTCEKIGGKSEAEAKALIAKK